MDKIKIDSRIWIKKGRKNYLGKGRIELLRQIQNEGSILKASKKMYMSYKAAWDNLHQIKAIGEQDLIVSNNGGRGGGGTYLTPEGKRAIEVFDRLERLKVAFWERFDSCQSLGDVLEKIIELEAFLSNLPDQNP